MFGVGAAVSDGEHVFDDFALSFFCAYTGLRKKNVVTVKAQNRTCIALCDEIFAGYPLCPKIKLVCFPIVP